MAECIPDVKRDPEVTAGIHELKGEVSRLKDSVHELTERITTIVHVKPTKEQCGQDAPPSMTALGSDIHSIIAEVIAIRQYVQVTTEDVEL